MIRCSDCGRPLIDAIDREGLVVGGQRIPFRRATDFLACPSCGALHPVASVRAEMAARAQRRGTRRDDAAPAPSDPSLQEAADEALAELHELVESPGTEVDDDETDALLVALSDLAREAKMDEPGRWATWCVFIYFSSAAA